MYAKVIIHIFTLAFIINTFSCNEIWNEIDNPLESFKIEGKAINQFTTEESWVNKARVVVDGGVHLGFLKADGSFILNGIPSGSYVVELLHPTFEFDPVRVEITSKGKIRARGLDNIQPFVVRNIVVYPLRMRCRRVINYFQQREQLHISDFLFNPMVMTMLISLIFILLLPKLMNSQDPELQREMQQSMNLLSPKNSIDIPEMFAKWSRRNPLASTSTPKNPASLRAKKAGIKVNKLKQG